MVSAKVKKQSAEPAEEVQNGISLSEIAIETMFVPIRGTSPLIVHRFSEKAKRMMLDNAMGKKSPKEPKNPQEEYEAAFYRFADGGTGVPVTAFKQATIGAARFYGKNQVQMTSLKQFIFVSGEIGVDGQSLARIVGDPHMREDVVRVGRGGADLRYRPEYMPWSTTLRVTYVTSALTRDSVLSLINAGGMGVGVGEWRPERDGDNGRYTIDGDIEVIQ